MATGVVNWSKTAASNSNSDSAVNWAEGQAPSSVNDSARAEMAAVAKWRDDLNGTVATSGGTTAYTATSNQGLALTAGYEITFAINATNTGTTTLNVDSLGAKPLRSAPGVEIVSGALIIGGVYRATYATSNSGEWLLQNYTPTIIAANQVVTASITDANVTLAKIASQANNTVLGNISGSSAAPAALTLGAGLSSSGTTITSAFPPNASFKNLSIKVASNTTVTVAADFVTTTDGTTYQTTALSGTINLGTNGAVNALDAGTIAIDTWYYIWAIAKADGTTGGLASTSSTAPTLPTGYTFKARIGAVQTIHGSATLYGTWQFGRQARYVVGLAQTANLPLMTSVGSAGSVSSPTWIAASVTRFVPTTASAISVILSVTNGPGMLAPNNSYGANTSTTNPPPFTSNNAGTDNKIASLLLESTNVYWAATSGTNFLAAYGWEDNI